MVYATLVSCLSKKIVIERRIANSSASKTLFFPRWKRCPVHPSIRRPPGVVGRSEGKASSHHSYRSDHRGGVWALFHQTTAAPTLPPSILDPSIHTIWCLSF